MWDWVEESLTKGRDFVLDMLKLRAQGKIELQAQQQQVATEQAQTSTSIWKLAALGLLGFLMLKKLKG